MQSRASEGTQVPGTTGRAGSGGTESPEIDPLLAPLLPARNDGRADKLVSDLITAHARPVIEGIIRYKLRLPLHRTTGQTDADDLRQEAIVQLLAHIRKFREQPTGYPIADLRGLAAVITHRTCSRWMRRQFPKRHALKNRLYYLLTRRNGFALWPGSSGKPVAGYAAWRGQTGVATEERFKQLLDEDGFVLIPDIRLGQASLHHTLAAIFDRLGSPLEFDKLVGGLARFLPMADQPVEATGQSETIARTAAAEAGAGWLVEKRIFLQKLWQEVCQLPLHQRMALLLNLRDAEGGGCIVLLPAMGIATLRELAAALEMSVQRFASLWNDLPLEDARIAELLRLTRQQVINARKSARERLTRKLRGFI